MQQKDYEFFKDTGYLSLGKILSDSEIVRFVDTFDRDRRDFGRSWTTTGIWQTENLNARSAGHPGRYQGTIRITTGTSRLTTGNKINYRNHRRR